MGEAEERGGSAQLTGCGGLAHFCLCTAFQLSERRGYSDREAVEDGLLGKARLESKQFEGGAACLRRAKRQPEAMQGRVHLGKERRVGKRSRGSEIASTGRGEDGMRRQAQGWGRGEGR